MAKKDDIEDLLFDINNMTLIDEGDKSLQKKAAPLDLDVSDKEDLAIELIKITRDDRKMADKLFELFYPEIMSGQDRSQASKEALSRALELKIAAGKNIIDLLKIMKAEEKSTNAVGIFFNEKKAGIDIASLKDKYEDED